MKLISACVAAAAWSGDKDFVRRHVGVLRILPPTHRAARSATVDGGWGDGVALAGSPGVAALGPAARAAAADNGPALGFTSGGGDGGRLT